MSRHSSSPALERLSEAISDIGERIGELEEQVIDRLDLRPSRTERIRRSLERHLPTLHQRQGVSRYVPEFLSGWSLPTTDDARSVAHSVRNAMPDWRHQADELRAGLDDVQWPSLSRLRRQTHTERRLDFLRDRPTTSTLLIAGGAILAVGAAYYATRKLSEHTEEPDYDAVRQDGDVEIRDYDGMVIAETIKSGYHEKARRNGFETLADYIFAHNRPGKKIAMTAPVMQQLAESEGRTKGWAVRFVMPKKYTKESLPLPGSSDVTLKEVPARRMVAIRFSGNFTASLASKKLMALYNYLADENLKQKGDPIYAFYNPPWTPGFLKRNEILIEIER
ncbi:heme-binding protein [Aurantimonas sp. MSK8Z-1]|uniref:SOUL family heme-binding protein n=1 Tax=Mangrovibrevibacter kandeliae TaxID=2968473 RepID=UPI00211921CC|nr:heme-binding protein [Aurantimonas sp. MSK8Z-1]MCW4114261.1 heme-binding protein [Aurantimonas sp. MSK8Z-1]